MDDNRDVQRFRYLVLYTDRTKQVQLTKVLSEQFPKEHGRVFLPQREYWIRKTKTFGKKPLFPGYLFVHTDMSQKELVFVCERTQQGYSGFCE
ncbi:MAG: hypothetical protein J6N53_06550 [Lachnospiraceae bacterium]|nr:hypothetical protein [Lachnospiraceae bacterium]